MGGKLASNFYLNGVDVDCPPLVIIGGLRIGSSVVFRHITGHGNVNNSGVELINTRDLPAQTEPSGLMQSK